jgi:hypothetical protein
MKLLTKALQKAFEKQGRCEEKDPKDVKIIAKFFNPSGRATWYATEYDPINREFYGFVSLFGDYNDEMGYFSLGELEDFRGKYGVMVERDLYFREHTLDEVLNGARP